MLQLQWLSVMQSQPACAWGSQLDSRNVTHSASVVNPPGRAAISSSVGQPLPDQISGSTHAITDASST